MSLDDVKRLLEDTKSATVSMRESFEAKAAELAKTADGLKPAEELAAKMLEIEERNAEIDKQLGRIDELEMSVKRSKAIDNAMDMPIPNDQKAAYDAFFGTKGFMRTGDETEVKAMTSLSDPNGGYLIPKVVSDRLLTIIRETSPVRQYAYTEPISGDRLILSVDEDEASAYWGTSVQTPTQTNTPTVGQQEIPVRDLNAEPRAAQNFLDDAASDPEAWLMRKVSEKFARAEATAFVSGDGVSAPRGFLTYPAGAGTRGTIEQVNGGDASALTDELIIKLETALKAGYRSGAIYWMARATEGKVRLMKDGMGNYMWQPSYQLGAPRTLNGYPYALFEDMPAVAANALAVGFGNLRTGYTIVDRQGVRVLRDPYTAKPFVKFFTTKRVGGDVTNFEAIKIGKVAV